MVYNARACKKILQIMFEMHFTNELLRQLSVFLRYFEVITCTYAVLRNANACSFALKNVGLNVVLSSVLLILATLSTTALYVLALPLVLYKIIITFMLAVKYMGDFGGLLKGADVIFSAGDGRSSTVVTYLLVVQFDKSKADFLEYAKKAYAERFLRFSPRLTCVRRSFMGYGFLVRNRLAIDDVVRELPASETLRKTVQEYCNKPLPKNDTATWELLVGTQPVYDLDESEDLYPLLIRIHHTIADGVTFLSLLAKYISDEKVSDSSVSKSERSSAETLGGKIKKFARLHSHMILFRERADVNELRKPNLSGVKRVGMYVERERRYLKIVRGIKGRVEGATFSSIVLTAVSASLDEYLKKKAQPPSEALILSFIEIADRDDLKYDHADLANIFSLGSIKLPVAFDPSSTLLERFLEVRKMCADFARSHDIWINHCLLHALIDLLPATLLLIVLKMCDVSAISFSNLPGLRKIHIGGNALRHLLFWSPNFLSIGMAFSLITYDDRFQMGLMVDEVVVPEEDDVQEILDGVLKYIDLMDVMLGQ